MFACVSFIGVLCFCVCLCLFVRIDDLCSVLCMFVFGCDVGLLVLFLLFVFLCVFCVFVGFAFACLFVRVGLINLFLFLLL